MGQPRRFRKISESQLFAAIFFELSDSIGDQLSSRELARATAHLVRLIENDFGLHKIDKVASRSNYYSHETDTAILTRHWQILCRECTPEYLDGEIAIPGFLEKRLLELGMIYD